MKKSKLKINKLSVLFCLVFSVFCFFSANAQSTRQDFPSPITNSEISGRLPARDVGDARLTNYFYTFNGTQGDVFVNVQTSNFNGDIEIFTADNLRSLTKITIYADISENETGRVIYLRKPEKLILRIQGRSPNDDAATYRVKFAGSFESLPVTAENFAPELPEVKSVVETDVRVNSVGTIIEAKPKPTPVPKEVIAKVEKKPKTKKLKTVAKTEEIVQSEVPTSDDVKTVKENPDKISIKIEKDSEEVVENNADEKEIIKEPETDSSTKIQITDETISKNPEAEKSTIENTAETPQRVENAPSKTEEPPVAEISKANPETPAKKTVRVRRGRNGRIISRTVVSPKPTVPNPLENIKLIVLLKNGTKVEYQMSEVVRLNIIKGILTITTKGGKIERHSIFDVERTVIE